MQTDMLSYLYASVRDATDYWKRRIKTKLTVTYETCFF